MKAFEYASPTTLKEAVGMLGSQWGETEVLAGGTDVLSLMKEYVSTPKRVVNIKSIAGLNQIKQTQAQFLQRSANLPAEDRDHLWRPVQDDKIRACHFLLAHDFARAMAYLREATTKAAALVTA